jgi:hypothetical protein
MPLHLSQASTDYKIQHNIFTFCEQYFGIHDIDLCCLPDGSNSMCADFSSNTLLDKTLLLTEKNSWCHPPVHLICEFVNHFLTFKIKSPLTTRMTLVVPVYKNWEYWKLINRHFDVIFEFGAGKSHVFTGPPPEYDPKHQLGMVEYKVAICRDKEYFFPVEKKLYPRHPPKTRLPVLSLETYVPPTFFPLFVLLMLTPGAINITYDQAKNIQHWIDSMKKEMSSIISNKVYIQQLWEAWMHVVKTKFIYKTKYLPSGEIDKHKSRLVALGYSQKHGVDFWETYAPVAQLASLRLILILCVQRDLTHFQFDIGTAFLNATLDEDIYVEPAPGYPKFDENGSRLVWKLLKSLYGLKQAPRDWNKHFTAFLKTAGFVQSAAEPCLFIYENEGVYCVLAVYVDDVRGGHNNATWFEEFIDHLKTEFEVTLLAANYLLGMQIDAMADKSLKLHQHKYITDLVERFSEYKCESKGKIPMNPDFTIVRDDISDKEREGMKKLPYQSLSGALLWIARCSRPDISFAVNVLCRYNSDPSHRHWKGLLQVLKYLENTIDIGIIYKKTEHKSSIICYSDADHAGCHDTSYSTTGICTYLYGMLLDWSVRKQTGVSKSTTEAEYIGMSDAGNEVTAVIQFLETVKIYLEQKDKPILFGDNTGAVFLTNNAAINRKNKHIRIAVHHIRDLVSKGIFITQHIGTKLMKADIFTKALNTERFMFLRDLLGLKTSIEL